MDRGRLRVCCALLVGGLCLAAPAPVAAQEDYRPGRVIVRYDPGTGTQARAAARAGVDAVGREGLGLSRAEVIELAPGQSVTATVAELNARAGVAWAQPDWVYDLEAVPNDPGFPNLWALNNTGQIIGGSPGIPDADVDAVEAWDLNAGSEAVIVGVIDSGVKTDHPDLAPNVFVNPGEAGKAPGVDDDGNGLIDDVTGFDFFNDNGTVNDDFTEHGTLVASVIGARGSNGLGVTGIAQRVRILPLQGASPSGGISTAAAVEAIAYARGMGARVVNMSFGSFGLPDAGDVAIRSAIEASPGILFATSAGNRDPATNLPNDNDVKPHWPSNLTVDHANVVATANTTNRDLLSSGSSFGAARVDFAAPGTGILGAAASGTVFKEDFDSTAAGGLPPGWANEAGDTWAVTAERAESAPNSLTDSPGANYVANKDNAIVSPAFSVPNASTCRVDHVRRRRTANDFFRIEVSLGGGAFTAISTTTGDSAGEEFVGAIPEFTTPGPVSARVRFRLTSGASTESDGVHLDDIDVRCLLNEAYRSSSGTSFSSPLVAGIAALMVSHNGALGPGDAKNALRATVDPVAALGGRVATNGRVNAFRAVQLVTPDVTAARVTGMRIAPVTFLPAKSGATVRATALRRGSRLSFTVNEPVVAKVEIYRKKVGRRVGTRCLPNTRARRKRRRCTRFLKKGTFTIPGTFPAGRASRRFTGRLRRRPLAPGRYRLSLLTTDARGNRSKAVNKAFRIAKPPPRRRR